jgi:hypothetical protein
MVIGSVVLTFHKFTDPDPKSSVVEPHHFLRFRLWLKILMRPRFIPSYIPSKTNNLTMEPEPHCVTAFLFLTSGWAPEPHLFKAPALPTLIQIIESEEYTCRHYVKILFVMKIYWHVLQCCRVLTRVGALSKFLLGVTAASKWCGSASKWCSSASMKKWEITVIGMNCNRKVEAKQFFKLKEKTFY